MPDMMAIVSKAVFEKQAGKAPTVGTVLGMDRYTSANKNLEPLADGGRLYLVTVRPPDEQLWLVAILDQPSHDGEAWVAEASTIPITDISDLRSEIKFASGVGITAKKGALGMSLQTPRALTADDTALLDAAAGAGTSDANRKLAHATSSPGKTSGVRGGGLLDGILADPDNVDAKRVYADLLAQAGDPRGEFILLEIALDGPLSIRKRELLRVRHAAMIGEHADTWWPYKVFSKRTKHGFLRSVEGPLVQLRTAAKTGLFDKEPVTRVEVSVDDSDEAAQLVKEKWLSRVRRLVVRGELGDEGFTAIANAPAAQNLTSLNVTSCGVSGDALAELGAKLPRLTTLVLTSNPIGDDGLANLRQWKQLARVETLYLSGCELSAEGITDFLEGLTFGRLQKLTLRDNGLDDEIAAAFVKNAARLPMLRHLELVRTGVTDAGVESLVKAKLPSLRRIDVRRNEVGSELAENDARVRV